MVADQRLAGFEDGFNNYPVDIVHVAGSVESVLHDNTNLSKNMI